MQRYQRNLQLSILIAFVGSAHTAWAGLIITPTVTFSAGAGVYTYDYDLSNTGTAGIFSFSIGAESPVLTTGAPSSGWLVSTSPALDQTLVAWISTDPSFDVQPDGSLDGFQITSPNPPGMVQFSAQDESLNEFDGETTGPVAPATTSTPEPNSGILSILGAAIMAAGVKLKSFLPGQG